MERAKDLLRVTNLTVTEVCWAVGYASLGSFSSTFTSIVGEAPTAYRARIVAAGGPPRIPGCVLFMRGLVADHPGRPVRASEEKPAGEPRP